MSSFARVIRGSLTLLLALVPALLVLWKFQAIEDYLKLRNYQPPAAIAQIASQDTMTGAAKHIFYINHPQLVASRADFSKDCPSNEQTIVEGCYQSGESGIYIFDVKDKSLDGIEQVTAAHEMLHGAYDRLSSSDRQMVNSMLQDYYQHHLKDQRILKTIAAYKKTEPNDLVNEMHSIFGTEIKDLPAPLENYYKRYFTDRSKVVSYSTRYESQFTSRLNQINAYDAQLAAMKSQYSSLNQSVESLGAKLQSDRQRLDQSRGSGDTSAYNAGVKSYNNEVDQYNSQVSQLKSLITSYNSLLQTRNALAEDLRGLQTAIDTRLTAQPAF